MSTSKMIHTAGWSNAPRMLFKSRSLSVSTYAIFLCQELGIRTLTGKRFELTLKNLEIEPPLVLKIQRIQRDFRQNGASFQGVRSQVSAQEWGRTEPICRRFTLRFTRETAILPQIRKKRETTTETVSRFTFGRALCISSNLFINFSSAQDA